MTNYKIEFTDNPEFYVEMQENEVYEHGGTKSIYESSIIRKIDDKKIGFMNFSRKSSRIWLYKIEIDEEYRGKGLGSKMMNLLEYIASKSRCNTIEGKYYPTVNFGEHFYKKNGYSIEKDGYETEIYKYLPLETYNEYIDNFEITEEQKEYIDNREITEDKIEF